MEAIVGGDNDWGSAIYVESTSSSAILAGPRCRVFVSYARVDERYRMRLDVHLAPLVRDGLIDLWSDRTVTAGADWEKDIQRELTAADIVILLVTPDFVASGYCFEKELPEVLRRNMEEGVRVLPSMSRLLTWPTFRLGSSNVCLPTCGRSALGVMRMRPGCRSRGAYAR